MGLQNLLKNKQVSNDMQQIEELGRALYGDQPDGA